MSYSSMKLPELKEELKKRGLPVTGKKDELVQRLLGAEGKGDKEEEKKDKKEEKKEDSDGEKTAKEKSDKKGKRKAEDADEEVPAKKGKKESSEGDGAGILVNLKDEAWKEALAPEFAKGYFKSIIKLIETEKNEGIQIFPPENEVFSAFNHTPLDQVKVVILGQDPYHDDNQANGLCFSVHPSVPHPPSLKNIFKELVTDIPGFTIPKSGSLVPWADRGVLLLNATLTVQAHQANSHATCGWQTFTDAVIETINRKTSGVVFILWGGFAKKKGKIIDKKKHHVIEAAHPSPLSVKSFWGCKVFSKTNEYLKKNGKDPIDWTL